MAVETYPVRSQYRSAGPTQLVNSPVEALLTVSNDAKSLLNELGIASIFDLGASILFDTARRIVDAADPGSDGLGHFISADYLDNADRGKTPGVLADSPVWVLRQVGEETARRLGTVLGVTTIRELATWPAYQAARAVINDAYGLAPPIIDDSERPDDLIPVSRRYATERVQYDVIVMDRLLPVPEGPGRRPAVGPVRGLGNPLDIASAGGIDVGNLVDASLIARPAIGAVLTYRQSWFPQGLALGQLLHSMTLAPGESTRVAMVDWTRSVRARTTEDTTQTEALMASIERTRAMSEVTEAVAAEAQAGFSGSSSSASQSQGGISGGLAGILPGPALGVGAVGGSYSTASSQTSATGWSSSAGLRTLNSEMTQNINDRTHQAANSARNRRATAVTETSQQESETLTTRVVTNYNHMHALTIEYFEVVQIYRVVVELARKTRCIFVPMKLVTFTPEVIRRYRNVIASAGLTPEARGLSAASAASLVIQAPNRRGNWRVFSMGENLRPYGIDIGSGADPAIHLPIAGLRIWAITISDIEAMEEFTLEVRSRDGNVSHVHFTEFANTPISGATATIGGAVEPRHIHSVVLRRKEGQSAYTGTPTVWFQFRLLNASGSDVFDVPYHGLGIACPLTIPANADEVPVFRFDQVFADSDVVDHLEQHALHYSNAIWRSLDAATITTLLSSYEFEGRSMIEVIDPIPVSVSGNYVVFRLYGGEEKQEWQDFLQKHDLASPQPTEDLIPLPSSGVFAEAVLGRSNAAEKLDLTRFWNWQDSPIPILPPEIAPLTAGGKANDGTPPTGNLESPIVNIMNAPALPDPAGLAPLYSAISNGNMFRDMSGMAQVAALAGATMGAAQTGAGQAMTAAGAAQQVAAQLFTDVLELALAAAGKLPTGGLGGGRTGGGASELPQNPTNLGALLGAARELDAAESGAADDWASYPGASSTDKNGSLTPPPLVGADTSSSTSSPTSMKHQSAILHGFYPGAVPAGSGAKPFAPNQSSQLSDEELEVAWESIPGASRGMIERVLWEDSPLVPAGAVFWNFEVGQSEVENRFGEALDGLPLVSSDFASLRDRGYGLLVTGSASSTGSEASNQEYSNQRAQNVKALLMERYGISSEQIEARSAGSQAITPPARITDEWGAFRTTWLAWNRRVTIEPRPAQAWTDADYDAAEEFVRTWGAIGDIERRRLQSLIALLRDPSVDDKYIKASPAHDLRVFNPTFPHTPEAAMVKSWLSTPSQWTRFTWFGSMREQVALRAQGFATDESKAEAVADAYKSLRTIFMYINQQITIHGVTTSHPLQVMRNWIADRQDDPTSIYHAERA